VPQLNLKLDDLQFLPDFWFTFEGKNGLNLDSDVEDILLELPHSVVEIDQAERNKLSEYLKPFVLKIEEWYEQNDLFIGAMAHPELTKDRLNQIANPSEHKLFRRALDYWWNSNNREIFIEDFEDSIVLNFQGGEPLVQWFKNLGDRDEYLDKILNFISYRDISNLVDIIFRDIETNEFLISEGIIDAIVKPYFKSHRVLIPIYQHSKKFNQL